MSRIGRVVYWCNNDGGGRYSVRWGIVSEEYPGVTCVDYLEPMETRRVDGVPINNFVSEREYRKLPNGWTKDTELFKVTYDPFPQGAIIDVKDPDSILNAYHDGWLVKASSRFYGEIKAEVTKQGFRVVKRYASTRNNPVSASVFTDLIRDTYAEAEKDVDMNEAELKRQAELSDYDWSVEQIDYDLRRYQELTNCTDEEIKQIRSKLIGMDRVEDIETRIIDNRIQWKYVDKRKWWDL